VSRDLGHLYLRPLPPEPYNNCNISTVYTGGMANLHPSTPKSDEQETVNVRDRAVLSSRQHLRDLIREHPARARDLLKASLKLAH
jgi:hypothetical protein